MLLWKKIIYDNKSNITPSKTKERKVCLPRIILKNLSFLSMSNKSNFLTFHNLINSKFLVIMKSQEQQNVRQLQQPSISFQRRKFQEIVQRESICIRARIKVMKRCFSEKNGTNLISGHGFRRQLTVNNGQSEPVSQKRLMMSIKAIIRD